MASKRNYDNNKNIKKELENFIDKKFLCKVTIEDGVTLKMNSNKIRSHTLERPFKCNLCEYTSSCSYNISRHMNRMHLILPAGSSSKKIKSEEDNEEPKIKIKENEELNIKKEEDEEELYEENPTKKRRNILNERFECAICGLRSKFKRHLMKHISIKHPRANIESVEKKDGSQVHLIVTEPKKSKPSKRKPIRCEYCCIIFPDTWKHKFHLRSHTGVKPFECSICELKATSNNTIRDHIHRKHTKAEKPMIILRTAGIDGNIELVELPVSWEKFKCNQCSKLFNDNYTLKSHRNEAHLYNMPYSCNLCDYKAKTRANLILHCQEKHEEEDISNIILHKGKPIKVNSLINLPSCEICNKIFSYKSLLASHTKRIHKGAKQYSCNQCDYQSFIKNRLVSHTKKHHGLYIKEEIPDNKDESMDYNFEEESLDTKVKVEILDPT